MVSNLLIWVRYLLQGYKQSGQVEGLCVFVQDFTGLEINKKNPVAILRKDAKI